jgi:hypothetical protein
VSLPLVLCVGVFDAVPVGVLVEDGVTDEEAPAANVIVLLADFDGVTKNEGVVEGDAPSDREDVGVTV